MDEFERVQFRRRLRHGPYVRLIGEHLELHALRGMEEVVYRPGGELKSAGELADDIARFKGQQTPVLFLMLMTTKEWVNR